MSEGAGTSNQEQKSIETVCGKVANYMWKKFCDSTQAKIYF